MPTCGSYYYYLRKSKKVAKCVIDSIRHLKWAKKNIFPVEVPVVTGGGEVPDGFLVYRHA